MKRLLHKNFFTLVEILIAMGICVVGLCSIVAFFPVGANASRNASMASFAANTAEQILDFAKVCVEGDNGYTALRYFTSTDGKVNTGWTLGTLSTYVERKPAEYPSVSDDPTADESLYSEFMKDSNYPKNLVESLKTMLSSPTLINQNDQQLVAKIIPLENKVFYVKFSSQNESQEAAYEDFNCLAAIGAEPVTMIKEDGTEQKIPFAARLNVEISWPASLAYENRQKRTYSMEVFKAY